MSGNIITEVFTGKYDGVSSALHLEKGDIAGGGNVRKVSERGGWKGRKGSKLHNTTALESGGQIRSLHQFTNPLSGDYNFIAQVDENGESNGLLYEATNNPDGSTTGTTFGTSLGIDVGKTPGFSCVVGEYWFYADGSGRPVAWGGTVVKPMAFYVFDASIATRGYIDYSREVIDGNEDNEAIVLSAAADKFYILTQEPISGINLSLGDKNSNSVTIDVKAWRSGAWTALTETDGTADGGATLAKDGSITWTQGADEMRMIEKDLGYAYEIGWSGALSGNVTITGVTVNQAPALMTNKWSGEFDWVTGAKLYNNTSKEYVEHLGKVTNESEAQYMDLSSLSTSEAIYVKTPEPVGAFGISIPTGYSNDEAGTSDPYLIINYWDGDSWASTTITSDGTKNGDGDTTLAQTGRVVIDASAISPKRRTLAGDDVSGYWYQIMWDKALAADTRINAIQYAPYPLELPSVKGVVEFKGRLVYWGDSEYPNRLRISSTVSPFMFSGSDSGYSREFGDKSEIVCAIPFYNELLVFKDSGKGVYLFEGYDFSTFGILKLSDTLGLASPKTAHVAEVGTAGMHQDEAMTVAIWQEVDGIYLTDGRKPKKISPPVDKFFNPEYSSCIAATNIANRQAYMDKLNNEYHFFTGVTGSEELVFNYALDEWYPPWTRKINLTTGLTLKATNGRDYTYGGSASGFVQLLENDTSDKTTANADEAIVCSVVSRALYEENIINRFDLRRIWAIAKGRTAGTLHTAVSENLATSFTAVAVPADISLISTTNLCLDWVTAKAMGINCFQVMFYVDGIDEQFEIWAAAYETVSRGLV